jgi:SAM-dependent methyltransferase
MVTDPTLFDEPYYLAINRARWVVAERTLEGLRDAGGARLRTCLDVGCGPGWFSERLAARGLEVVGLDGRAATVAEARRRCPAIRFEHGDVESESLAERLGRFDLVFCFGLLYHTENPFRVVRNLRRMADKLLFAETMVIPDEVPCARLVAENVNETQGLTHYAFVPSRACVVKMLQAAGFRHVYEDVGSVDHEDFRETAARHRRRAVFVASAELLGLDHLVAVPDVPAPKYDFTRSGS